MIELNLTPKGKEQERVKEYLEQNVSETLAEKINNGVKITKEDKVLVNKKDLDGFIKFACEEARKQTEKSSNSACVEDETVFCWAIHYFEEDSIEGTLYNEDGTEYIPIVKTTSAPIKTQTVKMPENKQATLFDMFETPKVEQQKKQEEVEDENEEICEDDWSEEDMNEAIKQEQKETVIETNNTLVNTQTGEVIRQNNTTTSSVDKDYAIMLFNLLDGKLEVK